MTVRKTRHIRRVPVAEVYCSICEKFRMAYPNETEQLSVVVTGPYGGVEVGGVAVLPGPHSLDGW